MFKKLVRQQSMINNSPKEREQELAEEDFNAFMEEVNVQEEI